RCHWPRPSSAAAARAPAPAAAGSPRTAGRRSPGRAAAIAAREGGTGRGSPREGLCGLLDALVYGPGPPAPQCAMNTPSHLDGRRREHGVDGTDATMAPSPMPDVPMTHEPVACYPPLNTPKAIATDAWIVDGPIIRFGMPWPKMPFPTRMTLLRLGDGNLFVHSPTPLTDALRQEIASLGTPRWIIGPNRIHYWWIPEWKRAFPEAGVWLAPRIREQAGARIDFDAHPLDADGGYPWDGAVSTLPVAGSFMIEVEFFHHPSRTLVLTDLIENFEPGKR